MTVLVDAILLERASRDEKVAYVLELLTEEPIEAHLYSDEGPPDHASRVIVDTTGVEGVVGWASTHVSGDEKSMDVVYLKQGVPTRVPTQANDPVFLHILQSEPLPSHKPDGISSSRLRDDAHALIVAKAMRADLFITDRHLTLETDRDFWWTTTVLRPEDALPVVGLYLRQQGKFILARSPALGAPVSEASAARRDRATFYWQAAQEMTPTAWGWSIACKMHGENTRDDSLSSLPTALTWRVDQALRSRDRLLTTLAAPPKAIDAADEAVTELDQILLWLMAALDITAQVAHVALGIRMKIRDAAWQYKEWLKKVAVEDQALADLVSNNSEGEHLDRSS